MIFLVKIINKKADKKVYKTNEFIQKARFDLTLTQQKLILYAISKIRACSHKNSIKNHSEHDNRKKNNIEFIVTSADFSKTL